MQSERPEWEALRPARAAPEQATRTGREDASRLQADKVGRPWEQN